MSKLSQKLENLLKQLSDDEQKTLLDYAEFLVARSDHAKQQLQIMTEPLDIPRPQEESVVAAMKRLSKTYSMMEMDGLLHEAAGLMSAHIMQGREAVDVIDDLQVLFSQHYDVYLKDLSQ